MVGNFRFENCGRDRDVVVELAMVDNVVSGIVSCPGSARAVLSAQGITVHPDGTSLGLDFALSYGVLIATRSGTDLCLTGDSTLWPAEWGELIRVA